MVFSKTCLALLEHEATPVHTAESHLPSVPSRACACTHHLYSLPRFCEVGIMGPVREASAAESESAIKPLVSVSEVPILL